MGEKGLEQESESFLLSRLLTNQTPLFGSQKGEKTRKDLPRIRHTYITYTKKTPNRMSLDDSRRADKSSPACAGSSSSAKADRNETYDANIRNYAPVARIMKNALPDNAKIAKEAKECMQECVSEFISFITSEGELPKFSCERW
jgi:hypothetical protein